MSKPIFFSFHRLHFQLHNFRHFDQFLRPISISYLKRLEKSRRGLHCFDCWTRWHLENPKLPEYPEKVVFCTLTSPGSPDSGFSSSDEPSSKKLKLHKTSDKKLATTKNINNIKKMVATSTTKTAKRR